MGKTLQKKKGFSLPHVYAVILILMLLVAIMTYVVPAGSYVRVDNAVDPDSFTYAEQTPVGFLGFFTAIHQGVVESSNIIGAVLLISGCIQIIQYTGAFSAGIQTLIRKAKGKGLVMVLLVAPPLLKGKLYRWQGVALLALYAGYCAIQFTL